MVTKSVSVWTFDAWTYPQTTDTFTDPTSARRAYPLNRHFRRSKAVKMLEYRPGAQVRDVISLSQGACTNRRIGNAVKRRNVPNAVKGDRRNTTPLDYPGRRFGELNPSQKTGLGN